MLGNVDLVDHFISVSNFQRQKLIELGVPGHKISTVYNFADTRAIAPETTPGEYLLYFGRLERLKGVFTLVEAAKRAADVRLIIAGQGAASAELTRYAADLQAANVEFVGFKQGAELERLVRGSIATVLPSEGYDNCPMAILESYAHAKPVVGSRMGGIPELVHDQVDGLVFAPGDADALAAHLDWMYRHRDQAVQMGRAGRIKIEERFNADVHYQQVRSVYRQVGVSAGEAPAPTATAPLNLNIPDEPQPVLTLA
jgi:glycosyltransferase involved in cell wall biosynthesis